ncbi:MAG: hypothetical protein R2750_00095 [Bacteroidales bacterium]
MAVSMPIKKRYFLSFPSAGGFNEELEDERTIIISSSEINESASRSDNLDPNGIPLLIDENEVIGINTYNHGEANYHLYSSLAGETPDFQPSYAGILLEDADLNNDGFISIGESKTWMIEKESTIDNPVINDFSSIRNYTGSIYTNHSVW